MFNQIPFRNSASAIPSKFISNRKPVYFKHQRCFPSDISNYFIRRFPTVPPHLLAGEWALNCKENATVKSEIFLSHEMNIKVKPAFSISDAKRY